MHLIFPVKNNIHAYALDHAACVCSYEAHKYVGITVERLPVNKFTQKDFDHPILMQFEDAFFYAPQSWDDCLNFEYGNYMELPPEEKRLTHDLIAKWIESEIK